MSASSHSSRSRPYIPVIGGLLLQTLLHLVEGLEDPCNRVGYPNEGQTSHNDSQYTLAIVALAVLVLESAINPARFLRNEHGYGDKKISSLINQATRQTKVLGLNVFPTRIWRKDVLKVLGVLDSPWLLWTM